MSLNNLSKPYAFVSLIALLFLKLKIVQIYKAINIRSFIK
jgi:hypothetical protein